MDIQEKSFKLQHWQYIALLMMIYDYIAIVFSYFLALWVRFDFHFALIPEDYYQACQKSVFIYAAIAVLAFIIFKMYRSVWRFVSYDVLIRTILVSISTSILYAAVMLLFVYRMPISYCLLGAGFQVGFVTIIRTIYKIYTIIHKRFEKQAEDGKRIMLIGAGNAGQLIMRDIKLAKETCDKVVCFIDDNPNKWGRMIEGIPIAGGRDDILSSVEKYQVDKIFLAIPSASVEEKKEILNICKETNCELKQLPGMYQFVNDQLTVSSLKEVAIEDLLGREQIKADLREVFNFINGRRVLVTGGGGSIGSELCRQIAAHAPEMLIIFDVYENNAYSIQLELREKYPYLNLKVLIGSVRDSRRIYQVFEEYRPHIVYHAAAHKHVPLMEDSPCEAIKNNAIGTYKTAYAAMMHGCERFVLISTDKAVNPTNVMGASKRLCEMIIQSFDAKIKAGKADEIPELFTHPQIPHHQEGKEEILKQVHTEFVAVRFGNVLGSNGSVIPIFKKQIEEGGPVTVTHPDIIRYFMTIPEAVSLVMLAGTYADGGEIFVLDMGSPVKIDTLARNLIKLSGLKPDVDIKIEYTGLRPGEKLYEEKLMSEEGLKKTDNEMIHIGSPIPFDTDAFFGQLDTLMKAAYANKSNIRTLVSKVVTTYHPVGENPKPEKDDTYQQLLVEENE